MGLMRQTIGNVLSYLRPEQGDTEERLKHKYMVRFMQADIVAGIGKERFPHESLDLTAIGTVQPVSSLQASKTVSRHVERYVKSSEFPVWQLHWHGSVELYQ